MSSILLLCTYSSAQSDHTLPENENILNNNNGKNLNPQAQRSFGHNPPITCPDKFRYEYDQHGVLYGRVTIQRDPYAKQFVFEVNMTVNAPVQQNVRPSFVVFKVNNIYFPFFLMHYLHAVDILFLNLCQ